MLVVAFLLAVALNRIKCDSCVCVVPRRHDSLPWDGEFWCPLSLDSFWRHFRGSDRYDVAKK